MRGTAFSYSAQKTFLVALALANAAIAPTAQAKTAVSIDSAADASYCFRNGGQPTFANGEWDKCLLPSEGEKRATIYLPVRNLRDEALCSLAGGKVDSDRCAIP